MDPSVTDNIVIYERPVSHLKIILNLFELKKIKLDFKI